MRTGTEGILRIFVLFLTSLVLIAFLLVVAGVYCPPVMCPTPPTLTQTPEPPSTLTQTPDSPSTLFQTPIRISIAIALTGKSTQTGEEQREGAEIAEKFFNSKDGVNGRPIQVSINDATDSVKGAEIKFRELISNTNNIVAIIGPTYSTQAFSVDHIAHNAGIPVISASNTADGIPQIGEYVFRVSTGVKEQAKYAVSAAFAMDNSIKRVAIIYDEDDIFSTSEYDAFVNAIGDFDLSLVVTETFKTGITDVTAQINSILASTPDLVIVSGLTTDGGLIVKELRESGHEGLIIGGDSLNTPDIIDVCGEECNKMIMTQLYDHGSYDNVNIEFKKAYHAFDPKNKNKNPPQYTALMFTAIQVLVEALTELDKDSPIQEKELPQLRMALKEQLQKEDTIYKTPVGEIWLDSEGEVHQEALYTSQIIDGKIQIIK